MDDGPEPTDVEALQAQIEGGVSSSADAAREAAQEHERRLQERLASVERQGTAALTKKVTEERKLETSSFTAGGLGRGTGIGLSIAYALLGLPMVGFGLGWLADRGTDSNVFAIVGFCLGGAAGIWFSAYQMKRM